jgi:hypothetical protein
MPGKIMKRLYFLLIFQVILMTGSGYTHTVDAGNVLFVDPQTDTYDLAHYLSYIEDTKGTVEIEQIWEPDNNIQWQHVPNDSLNFGYTRAAFWFKLKLIKLETIPLHHVIEITFTGPSQ